MTYVKSLSLAWSTASQNIAWLFDKSMVLAYTLTQVIMWFDKQTTLDVQFVYEISQFTQNCPLMLRERESHNNDGIHLSKLKRLGFCAWHIYLYRIIMTDLLNMIDEDVESVWCVSWGNHCQSTILKDWNHAHLEAMRILIYPGQQICLICYIFLEQELIVYCFLYCWPNNHLIILTAEPCTCK